MSSALRVLHIISGDLWAGAEVQAFTLMTHLAQTSDTEIAAVVMNEGTLACKLRAAGIGVFVTNERELGPWRLLFRLRGVLDKWRPNLIHTHREKENILGTLANRIGRNVPSVRTVHGGTEHADAAGWRGLRHRMVMGLDRRCARISRESVIVVSKELRAVVARELAIEKVVVIENGVDADALLAQESSVAEFRTADPESTHIGIAGRLVQVKRLDLFLQTAVELRRMCPERRWRFHIFGDGPARSDLDKLSERMGISDVVKFHGHRHDIATCIGGLDALVICSDHEGMPMTALEAAVLEVPTVAHAVGGLPSLVPSEFLVTRHDGVGYAAAVVRALREDARLIAARRVPAMLERYSAKHNAAQVRALYDQLAVNRVGK